MNTELQLVDCFSDGEKEQLRSQGIDLDDWDYALLCDDLDLFEEAPEVYTEGITYEPKDWTLDRLLNGCCDNKWYKIKFNGKVVMAGFAYHAQGGVMYKVKVKSYEYGTEEFNYITKRAAIAGMKRLEKQCAKAMASDGIEREVWIESEERPQ